MGILAIAFSNFKNNLKVYTMYFVSMIFSMVILFNFENLIYGDLINKLDDMNAEYCSGIIRVITIILIVFMCFYIWYSSNTFLIKRKKEIGIYVFMGLDLPTIGKMYFLENILIGIFSACIGSGMGIIFSKLFQTIILKISDYGIKSSFEINPKAFLVSILIFSIIFLTVTVIGFINISMSKIVDLLKANKKQDFIPKVGILSYILGIMYITIIGIGYYLSTKDMSQNIFYMVISLILIIIGTYGFFKTFVVVFLNFLIKRKSVLYNGENIITINNISYRLRKNYKVYAIVTIILASTIISLATAVSMKLTYKSVENKSNVYTFSFISQNNINENRIRDMIENKNIDYDLTANMVHIDKGVSSNDSSIGNDAVIVKYDEAIKILNKAKEETLVEELKENNLKNNEFIKIQRNILGSVKKYEDNKINIDNKEYNIIKTFNCKFVSLDIIFFIVGNEQYDALKEKGTNVNFYGAKLKDESNAEVLYGKLISNIDRNIIGYTYLKTMKSLRWLNFVYGIGGLLFLVFILATGSILYMKVYNDATEDKEKYDILLKIGTEKNLIKKAISKEVIITYTMPLILASIHSYFAIKMLSKMLKQINLTDIYIISIVISAILFSLLCTLSIKSFKKTINI
ncbi:ABC transporter permease [Clostridium senegalense]|uniref:FtsX-like permease family protein n=1 Tax=Clostridium senegalense TaxID=1465809 RepID=UPI001C0FC9A5|nr:ABC transporter permease [Clostridium senegalense]MBU5227155.1 ABC transporter permease [Clostridium senegalense]